MEHINPVFCKNCKFYRGYGSFKSGAGCLKEFEINPVTGHLRPKGEFNTYQWREKNSELDCQDYRRKWWKFWAVK